MKTRKALLILAATVTASSIYADKIQFSEAPPAVQQAIRQKSGRHPIEDIDREVRNGQTVYEASWKSGGAQQELLVSEAGTILRDVVGTGASTGLAQDNLTLANKTGIELTETPRAVQAAIYKQIPTAPIDGVQKGIWNGQTIYEVTYRDNGKPKTYQVTESGQPVVGKRAVGFQPRYMSLADKNVPLAAGSKLAFETAPAPVQKTVQHIAGGARVEDFERGQWNGRTVYQAAFKQNGQHTELQVLEDGTILTKEPASPNSGNSRASVGQPARTIQKNPSNSGLLSGTYPTLQRPEPSAANANVDASSGNVRYAGLSDSNVQLSGGAKMDVNSAPAPVQNTLRQLTGGAQVEDLERGQWNGRTVYEAAFKRNGQHTEIQVLDDGSVLTKQLPTAAGSAAQGTAGAGQQ
jgi:uncharacterized membrane protein YkoI